MTKEQSAQERLDAVTPDRETILRWVAVSEERQRTHPEEFPLEEEERPW